MALNLKTIATLSQPEVVRVLHSVAESNTATFNELVDGTSLSPEQVLSAIDMLSKAHLIKATQSPIPTLATYYVTASGLQADRELGALM